MLLTADLECTTQEDDCRVWAWGVCNIDNPNMFDYGNTIEGLFSYMEKSKNSTFYFHNLKYDGQFILNHLFENGFTHAKDRKEEATKTFTTLISDTGLFYSIKIIFSKKGKHTKYVKIYDSLKIIPFSVDEVAKAFGLPINKLKINYEEYREPGHILTPHEVDYLKHDVEIMARALSVLFSQGLEKMTQGANALYDYKRMVTEKLFDHYFPSPEYQIDRDVRQSYKGGFTYLNPIYKNKDVTTGLVFDVNSLYPWVMHDCPLPYGEGIFFRGEYEKDTLYPLYIQMMSCQFEVKDNHIPTIQLKKNFKFLPTEYVTTTGCEEVTLCLTSVDLALFKEHYNIYNAVYHSGWKYKQATGLFSDYIDKWTKVKIESTINGNKGMRTLAKLMLNALYGKFGLNPDVRSKYPYYDKESGKVKYTTGEKEIRQPLYIPVASFITAYARDKTIRTAQSLYDKFIYADTDSLHLDIELPPELLQLGDKELEKLTTEELRKYGIDLPDSFTVDPVALGAWKLESKFYRARFIRQKSYIEDSNPPETWRLPKYSSKSIKEWCNDNEVDFDTEIEKYNGFYDTNLLKITCAGMPKACHAQVTWENFKEGATYTGKLQPKNVKGGVVLTPTEFTILKI